MVSHRKLSKKDLHKLFQFNLYTSEIANIHSFSLRHVQGDSSAWCRAQESWLLAQFTSLSHINWVLETSFCEFVRTHSHPIVKMKVIQSCLILCDPMDYTGHGILQARILEWVAFPFSIQESWGSSQPRNWTGVSCIAGKFFTN